MALKTMRKEEYKPGRRLIQFSNMEYLCQVTGPQGELEFDNSEEDRMKISDTTLPCGFAHAGDGRPRRVFSILNPLVSGESVEDFTNGAGRKYYVANAVVERLFPLEAKYAVEETGEIKSTVRFSMKRPLQYYIKTDSEDVDNILAAGAAALEKGYEFHGRNVSDEDIVKTLEGAKDFEGLSFKLDDIVNLDNIFHYHYGWKMVDRKVNNNPMMYARPGLAFKKSTIYEGSLTLPEDFFEGNNLPKVKLTKQDVATVVPSMPRLSGYALRHLRTLG